MTEPIICTEGTPLDWMVHIAAGSNELLIRRMSSSDPYSVTEAVEEGRRDGASVLVMCAATARVDCA